MAEEIRELIEKIKKEGLDAAQEKAAQVENQALKKADEIIKTAKERADSLLSEARAKAEQARERTEALLAQAGRDLVLTLRQEINAMLERLVASELGAAMSTSALQQVIAEIVRTRGGQAQEGALIISAKKTDLEALEKHFLSKLKEEVKKGIILRASQEARAGFTISFDAGKSRYDFTDKSLAEFIGQYLKPKLNEILKKAVSI
ncbi:MAG: hypothetical protein HY589_04215 [Candidatus Omnitrophica bacterium]|nr:hypothetical protein [Candidatus Omnitrophota bacterium]